MFTLIWPLLLGAAGWVDDTPQPTDSQIRRAHEMLAGTWQVTSVNDDGEILGPGLIRSKIAKDGKIKVSQRLITIVSPETGEKRISSFRLDPVGNPRHIDVTSPDDRLFRGIYQFQDESLVICLQTREDKDRPDDFVADNGSDRMLIRLKLADNKPTAAPAPKPTSDDLFGGDAKVATATSPGIHEIGPTEGELRRAHELLTGTWDILSIVDEGETLSADLIRAKFADDGRVHIGERTLAFYSPKDEEKRVSSFQIDPSQSPSHINLTTHFDESLKGIYRFDGDRLEICVAKHFDGERPTEFQAPAGSGNRLIRLKMVAPSRPRVPVTLKTPAPSREDQVRQALVGSWSYTDSKGTLTVVLQKDGTFVGTRIWTKALKRLFEGDTTTSLGRWTYLNGVIDARVSTTQDFRLIGRVYSGWVQSVGPDTLIVKNVFGQLITFRKLN